MTLTFIIGIILILLGIICMVSQKNLMKIILGFSILDTGIHIILVSIGYIKKGTAPILEQGVTNPVDPVPSALVLTSIVIGLAVTSLMLTFAILIVNKNKSLSIEKFKEERL